MPASLSKAAIAVLEKRYLNKDHSGNVIESPEQMFLRVASNIADVDAGYRRDHDGRKRLADEFFGAMTALEFLPNSPTLMNAGRRLQQLAACFVLPVDDSLDSIFESIKKTAIIHQSGGGTGFAFSRLRPANDIVGSTGGSASGPVSFMRVFNAATEAIRQGGARRGANMGVLRVDHPDIESFIMAKDDPAEFLNFNLSVALTDAFMSALVSGKDYELVNPRTNKSAGSRSAREVFNLIVEHAWRNGEPGVIFIDAINRANPTPRLGAIEATNPCGEQPLLSYEACNLGSINLGRMLKRNGKESVVDYEKLDHTVRLGVRFLDNVIDACRYPAEEIRAMATGNRKIGLGVMGFADMLCRLALPYESKEAVSLADEIMGFINKTAWDESQRLAGERGPFPNIKGSVFDRAGVLPVRNATTTTIAPTGTLSIIAGCSAGIEPFYALGYARLALDGMRMQEVNAFFMERAEEGGFLSPGLVDYVREGGDIKKRDDVPLEVKRVFQSSADISPEGHIRMQAAFQRHTDNAVSKTINLPHSSALEDVEKAYMLAYRLGLKGVTVYRSGTRRGQVLSCSSPLYC